MADNIQLGIIGSAGRMGKALAAHLETVEGIECTARLEAGGSIEDFLAAKPDVAVDLSLGRAVADNGAVVVGAGIPYIVGATGTARSVLDKLAELAAENNTPVLIVPNFSIGANLMIKFAVSAAKLMDYPVITERHHEQKLDAPSGTAKFTAGRMSEVRILDDHAEKHFGEVADGALGARFHGIPVHSIRGSGYLAEQEVRFTLPGEVLSIEHSSSDRNCFMPGIVYAIRNIHKVSGLAIGLDTILDT